MTIEYDIQRIKTAQNIFYTQYGKYFEIKRIPADVPDEGVSTNIIQFVRFVPKGDNIPIVTIAFEPTATDFQFRIGQHIFVNSREGGYAQHAEKRAYKIILARRLTGGIIQKYEASGGDKDALKMIDSE